MLHFFQVVCGLWDGARAHIHSRRLERLNGCRRQNKGSALSRVSVTEGRTRDLSHGWPMPNWETAGRGMLLQRVQQHVHACLVCQDIAQFFAGWSVLPIGKMCNNKVAQFLIELMNNFSVLPAKIRILFAGSRKDRWSCFRWSQMALDRVIAV